MSIADDGSVLFVSVTGSQKIITIDLDSLLIVDEKYFDFCPGKIAACGPQKLIAASDTKNTYQNIYLVDLSTGSAGISRVCSALSRAWESVR